MFSVVIHYLKCLLAGRHIQIITTFFVFGTKLRKKASCCTSRFTIHQEENILNVL